MVVLAVRVEVLMTVVPIIDTRRTLKTVDDRSAQSKGDIERQGERENRSGKGHHLRCIQEFSSPTNPGESPLSRKQSIE